MNRAERERLIHVISWGRVVTAATLQNGATARFVLRPASPEDNARAAIAYEAAYQSALQQGTMTETEALAFARETARWSVEEDEQIKDLHENIRKLVRGLLDYLFRLQELEKIRAAIRLTERKLTELYVKRAGLLHETVEQYATTAQQRHIISRVTETDDGKPFWPTEEAFGACTDLPLIARLVEFYFAGSRIEEAVIRELARTDPWRSIWAVVKERGQLFSGEVCSWSLSQAELARWSRIYDMVYESMERPSELVIDDDDLLDSWLIRQSEKIADGAKQKESERIVGAQAGKPGRNEVFIVADQKGAKRVYDLNDARGRRIVQQTQAVVAERGTVREVDLPQSQQELRGIAVADLRRTVLKR